MSLRLAGIGELVSNEPGLGEGPLGLVRDAALVIEAGTVVYAGPRRSAPDADRRVELAGRAVLPGFVDSHAHLVFAGDRVEEFTARMAGEPYTAGGIWATVAATRAAPEAVLRTGVARLVAEALRQGTTTIECKSGYGLTVADEARSLRIAAELTPETTFLGAHVVRRTPTRSPTWTACAGRCWPPARRTRAGWTCSASAAPSTPGRPGRC
jgi:imidazolonepropionase